MESSDEVGLAFGEDAFVNENVKVATGLLDVDDFEVVELLSVEPWTENDLVGAGARGIEVEIAA